jgi:hypothetical protein
MGNWIAGPKIRRFQAATPPNVFSFRPDPRKAHPWVRINTRFENRSGGSGSARTSDSLKKGKKLIKDNNVIFHACVEAEPLKMAKWNFVIIMQIFIFVQWVVCRVARDQRRGFAFEMLPRWKVILWHARYLLTSCVIYMRSTVTVLSYTLVQIQYESWYMTICSKRDWFRQSSSCMCNASQFTFICI